MSTRREFLLTATSLLAAPVGTSVYLTDAVQAQPTAPNMPNRNPWLAEGVYPTSHFNPGATDSVLHAGPSKGKKLTRDQDVNVVSNVMVSNPALKKVGTDTIGFASGTLGVLKILLTGKALDVVSFMSYPGLEQWAEKADEKGVAALLAEVDSARRENDDSQAVGCHRWDGSGGRELRDWYQWRL
jgi:hypothetical protein